MELKIGIVTASDRASAGVYEDESGKAIVATLREYIHGDWTEVYRLIPDEQHIIEATLRDLADNEGCTLVVTTGGTGPALRDVTPEATEEVCEKMMPGFGELMRQVSLKYVPTAILSRQTAGIRGHALIVNLPGRPKAIKECLEAVFPAIPYCCDLIGGAYITANEDVIKAFRPKA
jgi:molybdopterin adenylyltransferase